MGSATWIACHVRLRSPRRHYRLALDQSNGCRQITPGGELKAEVTTRSDFATEYSPSEKSRLLLIYLGAAAAVVFASKAWLFPAISDFAASAHCREVFGVPGVKLLFYGLFLGLPVFSALVVGLTFARRGYKILRDRQVPPIGERVFRPTPIKRGVRVKIDGYLHLLSPLPFLAIAAWGIPQAQKLSAMPLPSPSKCAAKLPSQRTPETLRFSVPSGPYLPVARELAG